MKASNICIEICAASLGSALNAQEGGAQRIELCSALEIGGLTPSLATIELVQKKLSIPIFVLIRPRGGDFCYSENEMQCMLRDIEVCKSMGIEGVVCGALQPNGLIHQNQTERMLYAADGMGFTFHRAFDRCKNPLEALQLLNDLGVSRILTSGQQANALEGAALIAKLVEKAEDKIIIMPGAGINVDNILTIRALTKAKEFHLSAKQTIKSLFQFKNDMKDEVDFEETNLDIVNKITKLVNKI